VNPETTKRPSRKRRRATSRFCIGGNPWAGNQQRAAYVTSLEVTRELDHDSTRIAGQTVGDPMNIPSAWRTSAAIAVLAMAPLAATVADSNPTLSTAAVFVKRAAMRH
jgi:hypothetical protein